MPNRLRSPLLALALAAIVVACATAALPRSETARDRRPLEVASAAAPIVRASPARQVARRVPPPKPKPTVGERAAKIALRAVGVPYRWGGSSRASGFDCSGLVYWAYKHLGVELPHSSYALYGEGRRVARSRLKAGDVLFFSGLGHVGLYLGRGRMVHAPRSGRLVEVVRLGGSGYGDRLVGARRMS